jgi:hypothetical protein
MTLLARSEFSVKLGYLNLAKENKRLQEDSKKIQSQVWMFAKNGIDFNTNLN